MGRRKANALYVRDRLQILFSKKFLKRYVSYPHVALIIQAKKL